MTAIPMAHPMGRVLPMPFLNEKSKINHKQIAIPSLGKIDIIDVNQIVYLKSVSNYTEVHLQDGSTMMTSTTLKNYEAKLNSNLFMRVHNSYIIQKSQLKSFLLKNNTVLLHNTQEIPVSRSKKVGLMKYLKLLMVSILSLFFFNNLSAQFTTWQQGDASDYYINFNWNGPTNWACDCFGGSSDEFIIFPPENQGNPVFEEFRVHNSSNYSGTASLPVGPSVSVDYEASMFVTGAKNNFIGGCDQNCNDSYAGDVLTFTTDPIYPADNIDHTWHSDGSLTLTWTVESDIPEPSYSLFISLNASNNVSISNRNTESHTFLCPPSAGGTVAFTTFFNFNITSAATVTYTVPPRPAGPGKVSGKVFTQSCSGVQEVIITATLTNPDSLTNGDCWPETYTTTTLGSNGSFTIDSLYIGEGSEVAEYEIEATFPDKEFRVLQSQSAVCTPAQDTVFLASLTNQNNQSTETDVDFVDVTSYVIRGKVTSSISGCGLEGVTIMEEIGGDSDIIPVETAGDGTYELVVSAGNVSYNIYAQYRFGTGAIMDSIITVAVGNEDVEDIDFVHTGTNILRGFIGGGCQEFLGIATLTARSPDDGCIIATINTNAGGGYEVALPSRPLELEVTDIDLQTGSGLTLGEVLSGFGQPMVIDFDTITTQDYIFRRPLTVKLSGLPPLSCAAIPHPIVQQRSSYFLTINVDEGEACPIDTGKIMIFNNISSAGVGGQVIDSAFISQGVAYYELVPGDPNFFGDFSKTITFQAIAGEEMTQLSDTVIVTGAVQSGNNFTTAAPTELPFLILRDPPGDQSYSEFIQENVTTISQSYSTQFGGGVKVWLDAKVGTDIFGLEIWGQIGASFEVNSSQSTTDEFILELTNSQTFRTSDNEVIVGERGDVFVGAAINFIYAKARTLDLDVNSCSFLSDTLLMMNADGFETTFIYTEHWIRNNVIPTRQAIADNESLPDSVRYRAGNDVNVWEQVLLLNQELKEEALELPVNNISFNSGTGAKDGTKTISRTSSKTIEFVTQIDVGIAAEVGFEFNNNGVTAGVDVNFQTVIGEIQSQSSTTTATTTWHIDDGEISDNAFTVNIAEDPVFGTPVFKLLGGQTSCPHEEGTQRLDDMTVVVDQPVQEISSGNEAFFFFNIISNSFDPGARGYYLAFNSSTAGGADVTYGGSGFAVPILVPNISPGNNPIGTPIKVTKPNGLEQYDFEGLEFFLFPACEGTVNYTTADFTVPFTMSAYFDSPCSDVDMLAPLADWEISSADNNQLFINMAGYDLSGDFDQIELQYKIEGSSWQPSGLIRLKSQLVPGSTIVPWDVSGLVDGNYEVRLLLTCGTVKSFSERQSGLIDRNAPVVFGLESPNNDRYRPGKEISVTFNEEINCAGLNNGDYYLKKIPQNELVPIFVNCVGKKITIELQNEIGDLYNQAFEVGLIGIADQYDNVQSDTVKWEFVVSEPDSDDDGNPDTKDFCPGGNDFIDTDLDGLPDDCDCVPNDPANGRIATKASLGFDGMEYIEIANDPTLVPTTSNEVTYETWMYPTTQGGNSVDIIAAIAGNLYLTRQNNNLQLFTSSFASPFTGISVNKWTHLAFVFKTDSLIVYQNGITVYSNAFVHQINNSGNPISIGGSIGDPQFRMDGRMDEFRIWDHARTQNEVTYFMNQELAGNETGLALYYNMNDGIPLGNNTMLTSLADQSTNYHDGTLVGFAKMGVTSNWVKDSPFQFTATYALCDSICPDTTMAALDFSPNIMMSPCMTVPNASVVSPTSSNAVTFEVWIKPDPISVQDDYSKLIDQFYGNPTFLNYEIHLTSDNKLRTTVQTNSTLYSSADIPDNEWTHIAMVFDKTEMRLYINGEFDTLQACTFPSAANFFYDHAIGKCGSITTGGNYYFGVIDEVRFWSVARTSEEIRNSYQTMIEGGLPGLEAYYTFNEGIPGGDNTYLIGPNAALTPDASGNGNDGGLSQLFKFKGDSSNFVHSPFRLNDEDKDGIPNFCDPCNAKEKLLLQNMALSNTAYSATREIILGENLTLPGAPMIELRGPKVLVRNNANVNIQGGVFTVDPEPCVNE